MIIPTRDRWHLLSIALTSVLRQQDVDLEVVVIDDGSSDQTELQLSETGDARLRVLRNSAAHGVAHARNQGVREARGTWLAFLDDDDVWAPRKLRAQLDAAVSANASFVFGPVLAFDDRTGLRRVWPASSLENLSARVLEQNVLAVPSALIAKSELIRPLGGFDTNLSTLADWDLWIRLAATGVPAVCNELLVGYRIHEQNMHRTIERADLWREYEVLTRKHGIESRVERHYIHHLAVSRRREGRRVAAALWWLRAARSDLDPTLAFRAFGELLGERLVGWARGQLVPGPEWLHPPERQSARAQAVGLR